MSREPTPKLDRLRELREANFDRAQRASRVSVGDLRDKIAAVPARKPKSAKKKRR